MPKNKPPTFETSFKELDETVRKLEAGELSLEDSISLYERGMALAAQLEQLLEQAELRVRKVQPSVANTDDSAAAEEE
jgi:exodeoxyribonuclease VII small subunit